MISRAGLSVALRGPWALTWQAWAVLAVPSVILTVNTFASRSGLLAAVAAGCANTIAFGAGMALARCAFAFCRQTPRRMLAAYFVAGALRALPVALLESVSWNPTSPLPNGWSLLAFSGMFGVVWLSLLAVLLNGLQVERAAQARLMLAAEQTQRSREAADAMLASLRGQLREQISLHIIPVIEDVLLRIRALDTSAQSEDLLEQARRLRDLAALDVRQLGRELLSRPRLEMPGALCRAPAIRMVLREALRLDHIRGVQTLSISLLMSISLAIAWGGPPAGRSLIGATIASMAWLALVEYVLLAGRSPSWQQTLASWTVGAAAYALILSIAYPTRGLELGVITLGGWVIIYTTLSLVEGLARMSRSRTLELAERETQLRALRELEWQQAHATRSRLGRLLHGPVQGRLASTALALRALQTGQAGVTLEDCASQLERTLDDLAALDATPKDIDLSRALQDIRQDWKGVMEVTFDLGEDQIRDEYVRDAIVECLSNAARHSGAHWAHVDVARNETGIRLVVTNDGQGAPDMPIEGAGWGLIRSSGGRVRLSESPGQTTVTAWWPAAEGA